MTQIVTLFIRFNRSEAASGYVLSDRALVGCVFCAESPQAETLCGQSGLFVARYIRDRKQTCPYQGILKNELKIIINQSLKSYFRNQRKNRRRRRQEVTTTARHLLPKRIAIWTTTTKAVESASFACLNHATRSSSRVGTCVSAKCAPTASAIRPTTAPYAGHLSGLSSKSGPSGSCTALRPRYFSPTVLP